MNRLRRLLGWRYREAGMAESEPLPAGENWRTVARTWEALARSDPLWAVLSEPDKRARTWNVEAFLATVEAFIEELFRRAEASGGRVRFGRAVDFGCGVGRLSRALASRFGEVVGVDVSPTMVEIARALNQDRPNLSFLLNQRGDLRALPDGFADLACSHITLQHIEPALAERYIAEMFRITRPGGLVYMQTVSHLIEVRENRPLSAPACRADIRLQEVPKVLPPRSAARLLVRVRNSSPHRWDSPLNVGNHWRDRSGRIVMHDDGRAPLPFLSPGEEVDVPLTVIAALSPGSYTIEVDIVQEGINWFADMGNPTASAVIVVEGGPAKGGAEWPPAIVDRIAPSFAPATPFDMHGIPRERVESIARSFGARCVRCDEYIKDWVSHEHFFQR
jgi:SAM-dependent methyltransferase